MDFLIEVAVETAGELLSEGIDAVITSKKEKKMKKNQEEKTYVNQEFDY